MPHTQEGRGEVYKASTEDIEHLNHVYVMMDQCIEMRQKPFNYFDNQSLESYINESVKRWNSYLPPRSNDWRSSVFMPDTRNKLLAILSFVAAQRQRAEFIARDKYHPTNKVMSSVLKTLYDFSMDAEGGDMKFVNATLENLIKGTVIVHEGYNYHEREVKRVTKYDPMTDIIEFEKEKIIDEDNCIQRVIPLEDVYIPDFYQPDIQKQPYVIVREEMDITIFLNRYKKWDNAKHVKTKRHFVDQKEGNMFYYERWGTRAEQDTVEVLHYYNKWDDVHTMIANGVLLTRPDRPILFDHKQYPFAKTINEPMAIDFFYGKSLPQKILSEQDVINTLYNMLLDRTYLSVMPWFITSVQDEIEESEIGPMQRVQVSDVNQFREANIQAVQQGELQMLSTVRDSVSSSTVDDSMMGVVADGTATAALQARESATRILGLLIKFMSELTYQQAKLRTANILQFYPKPNTLLGDQKEFRAEGQILSDGKVGIKVVRMIDKKEEAPTKEKVLTEAGNSELPVEIVYITTSSLIRIDYDIKIVPTSSIAESKTLEKALGLEYNQVMLSAFPDMVNRDKLFEYMNELFDQSPEEMRKSEEQMTEEQMMMNAQAGEQQEESATPELAQQVMGNPQAALGQLING